MLGRWVRNERNCSDILAFRSSLICKGSFQPPPPQHTRTHLPASHQIHTWIKIQSYFAAETGDIYSCGPLDLRSTDIWGAEHRQLQQTRGGSCSFLTHFRSPASQQTSLMFWQMTPKHGAKGFAALLASHYRLFHNHMTIMAEDIANFVYC